MNLSKREAIQVVLTYNKSMYIDLHCHTKNAKSNETKREVDSATFLNSMLSYGVGIVAITNHNMFCKEQYDEFSQLDSNLLVWPGIELDVDGDKSGRNSHGHVIIISNPKYVSNFNKIISDEIGNIKPDDYSIKIDNLLKLLNKLNECLIICHYMKSPELSYDDIKYLEKSLANDKIVLLEPSNSRKAALLYYDDEEQSWFGSDVTDWSHYPNEKSNFVLPECKFDIKSFEKFFYLLKKNRGTVLANGYLDPKKSDLVHVAVFDDLHFDYQIFSDVNVVFGGKATAKTSILEKLEEYYLSKSKNVASYYVEKKENSLQQLVVKNPSESLIRSFDSTSSRNDIEYFKKWKWSEIPSLLQYYKSEETFQKNAIINKLKISKASFHETLADNEFVSVRQLYCDNLDIISSFTSLNVKEYLSSDESDVLNYLIGKISSGERQKYFEIAINYYSKFLEKWTIDKIKTKLSATNSVVSRPTSTGMSTFFTDYSNLIYHLSLLKDNLKVQKVVKPYQIIGTIPFKGNVYRKVLIGFPPQEQSKYKDKIGGSRSYLFNQTKTNYDSFKTAVNSVKINESTDNISENVKNLSLKIEELKICSLTDFLNYSTFLATDTCEDFLPSNGVTSILLVEAALQNDDADVIILDEPDSGMGADFINNDLITKINNRAKENKTIIIATHDPNLVVRTHPYSCLYREEIKNEEYVTYIGSSFDEELVDVSNPSNKKKWVEACVDKCEGGHSALNERINTYGKR